MTLPITSGKTDIFLIINNNRKISINHVRGRLAYLSILSVENITKLLSYEEANEVCIAIEYKRKNFTEVCQVINK